MIIMRSSTRVLFTGILGMVLGGCGDSGSTSDTSTGGAKAETSNGAAPSKPTGQSGTTGTAGSGGTSASSGPQSTAGASGTPVAGAGGRGNPASTEPTSGSGGRRGSTPGAGGRNGTAGGVGGSAGTGAGGKPSTAGGSAGSGGKIGGSGGSAGSTNPNPGGGTCTASVATNGRASGTGPHKVTVETNADSGIKEGTIYRPADLGGAEKYPIFVWGEGGCSEDGSSNSAAMAEIASHGYFVIADGTPGNKASRTMDSGNPTAMGKPLLAYIDWAIAENEKPCSAYYKSLDSTKIASNGFSCGGLMSEGASGDPRMTTWGLNSSGLFAANQALYKAIHTPVLLVLGGSGDMAYENGLRDYQNISPLGFPVMFFSKALGHGGDLFSANGGDFTKINLAWLNWWLKGDEGATGKGVLVGASCKYCTDSAWEVKSANIP